MAGYGCMQNFAQVLGETKCAHSLQKTLDEQGAADSELTKLADRMNVNASEHNESDTEEAIRTTRRRRKATIAIQ